LLVVFLDLIDRNPRGIGKPLLGLDESGRGTVELGKQPLEFEND
jgi:hypothetical protein